MAPWTASTFISISVFDFILVLLTGASLWVVSKKSRHPVFFVCVVLIELAAAISFMQIRHGPARAPGWWLMKRGGKDVTPKAGPSHGLRPGQTLNIVYMVLCNCKVCVKSEAVSVKLYIL